MFAGRLLRDSTGGLDDGVENPGPNPLGDGPGADTGDRPGAGEATQSGGEVAGVTGVENKGPNPLTPGDRPGPDTGDGPGSAKAGLRAGEAPSSPDDIFGLNGCMCVWASRSETPTNPTACDSLC
jgi:hypothetical protein